MDELDKNTYDFMVDEFGRIIEEQKGLIAEMNDTIAEKDAEIERLQALLKSNNRS